MLQITNKVFSVLQLRSFQITIIIINLYLTGATETKLH